MPDFSIRHYSAYALKNWLEVQRYLKKRKLLILGSYRAVEGTLRCVHTMLRGRKQHTAALPHGKSYSAYAANLIASTLKKNFLQTILQKLWNETSELRLIFFSIRLMPFWSPLKVHPHYAARQNAIKCDLVALQIARIMWTSMGCGLDRASARCGMKIRSAKCRSHQIFAMRHRRR